MVNTSGSVCPFDDLVQELGAVVSRTLSTLGCNADLTELPIEIPPRPEFGDIAVVAARLMRACRGVVKSPRELAIKLGNALKGVEGVGKVEVKGIYVNIFIDREWYGRRLLEHLKKSGDSYGVIRDLEGARFVIDYVSLNPVHPLHIGSGRNAALGEFVARALEARGAEVSRRYYVNDLGLQVAYMVYGYRAARKVRPPEGMKIDHYMGVVYAAAATAVELEQVRKQLEEARQEGGERYRELLRKADELVAAIAELRRKAPEAVDAIIEAVKKEDDPEAAVRKVLADLEFMRDEELAAIAREAVENVLVGVRETLERLGISMDAYDWESDLVKEGLVAEVLEKARRSPYYMIYRGVPALDVRKLAEDRELRKRLRIPEGLEIPPLILVRSDGTTLYTTKDIAYTLKKFRIFNADQVINVIAVEQTLPQAQVRLALYAIGHVREAENLIHYAYEMVTLPGGGMKGRRGRYVTVDQVLDTLEAHVRAELGETGREVDEEVVKAVARSAFKYMMLSVSPLKPLIFDYHKALDIRSNSAPYIMYTYARTRGIFRNLGRDEPEWEKAEPKNLEDELWRLVYLLGKAPLDMSKALRELRPEDLITAINEIANLFNSWYSKEPIIREPDKHYREFKIAITWAVSKVLENAMDVLGLDILEKI